MTVDEAPLAGSHSLIYFLDRRRPGVGQAGVEDPTVLRHVGVGADLQPECLDRCQLPTPEFLEPVGVPHLALGSGDDHLSSAPSDRRHVAVLGEPLEPERREGHLVEVGVQVLLSGLHVEAADGRPAFHSHQVLGGDLLGGEPLLLRRGAAGQDEGSRRQDHKGPGHGGHPTWHTHGGHGQQPKGLAQKCSM